MASRKIKVLIVDDSALTRLLYTELLNSDSAIEVIGEAGDPYEAREKIKELNPDVLTLDIKMPKMDGISFLEKIMELRPMPVVMVSALTQKGASETIRCLELGAVDYVSKPLVKQNEEGLLELRSKLISKVKVASVAHVRNPGSGKPPLLKAPPISLNTEKVVAIGASTGGVEALGRILCRLPKNFPPILIVQHMPKFFTASFAKRLNSFCSIKVHEAEDGMRIHSGNAYIAPGGQHLQIARDRQGYICRVKDGERVNGHVPSVDILFDSIANVVGSKAVGALLTGMGKDGAQGMLKLKKHGGKTIAQDEESCVVYGMPKAAMALKAVDVEAPLDYIAEEILIQISHNI